MYYHGTDKNSAENIIRKGFMRPSVGDHHWLGNGCYFYKDELYAFRWILLKYTDNFKNQYAADYGNIYREYAILEAEIDENVRIFSMQDINSRLFFIKTKNELKRRAEYFDRIEKVRGKSKGIVDGVVFNILFDEMGLDEEYDAIEADFTTMNNLGDSRLEYLSEVQLCIRNYNVVKAVRRHNGESVPKEYNVFVNEYNQMRTLLRQQTVKNKTDKVRSYKKRMDSKTKYHKGGRQYDGLR